MDACANCGAAMTPELAWCGRCQAPRTARAPAYGQSTLPHPERPALGRWEWSPRGYGPSLRVALTAAAVGLNVLLLFGITILWAFAIMPLVFVFLRDVWTRHREQR